MSLWNGRLCNSNGDVLIDTVLMVFIVCAYIPQFIRLWNSSPIRGISTYYILFNVLFSNAQLSYNLILVAYAWPTNPHPLLDRIGAGSLKGIEAFGGILGLLQSFVQWLCSIIPLVQVSFAAGSNGRNDPTMLIISFIHALLVLYPIAIMTLPRPTSNSMDRMLSGLVFTPISWLNMAVVPCALVLQYLAQYLEVITQNGDPGAFSLLSIGLQVPAMAILGLRWFLRLGRLGSPSYGHSLHELYAWVFPSINYVLYAAGNVFLLACYHYAGHTTLQRGNPQEQTPLLE